MYHIIDVHVALLQLICVSLSAVALMSFQKLFLFACSFRYGISLTVFIYQYMHALRFIHLLISCTQLWQYLRLPIDHSSLFSHFSLFWTCFMFDIFWIGFAGARNFFLKKKNTTVTQLNNCLSSIFTHLKNITYLQLKVNMIKVFLMCIYAQNIVRAFFLYMFCHQLYVQFSNLLSYISTKIFYVYMWMCRWANLNSWILGLSYYWSCWNGKCIYCYSDYNGVLHM